jgi:predicted phosphodiesterase
MEKQNFLIWSDIHEEFEDFILPESRPDDIDAILIAGDIWTKGRAIRKLERIAEWAGVPIVATAGNHDYYGSNMLSVDRRIAREAEESKYDIRFLNPGSTIVNGCRIIGATLWTDYRLRPDEEARDAIQACERVMSDHKKIRWGHGNMRPVKANDLISVHHEHRLYIQEQLRLPHDGPTLVMTHHAPSEVSVQDCDQDRLVDNAYASNMEGMIKDLKPDAWVHGHTHIPMDYEIGDTRVWSNPKGYPDEKIDFDPMKIFTITGLEPESIEPC